MSASWTNVSTDHKLIVCDIQLSTHALKSPAIILPATQALDIAPLAASDDSKQKWNIQLLQDANYHTAYQLKICTELSKMKKMQPNDNSVNDKWKRLTTCLLTSARSTLNKRKNPLTPERKKILNRVQKTKFATFKNRTSSTARIDYKQAIQDKNEIFKKQEQKEIQEFFDNLEGHDPQVRIRLTFKFLRRYRQQKSGTNKGIKIPLSSWESALRDTSTEPRIHTIEETDHWPIGPPPTEEHIQFFLRRMRNGTAAGVDTVNVELLKAAPEPLIKELTELISDIWFQNEVPSEWLTTIQIPIPKKGRPKRIEDFRRITLCSVAYKVYAMFLLERLLGHVQIPLYQAGFQRNRSSDDQIFVLKRILEERWRLEERTDNIRPSYRPETSL